MEEDKQTAQDRPSSSSVTGRGRVSLDDELVPLSVAAQVAYFHLNGTLGVPDNRSLEELVRLGALALAEFAPICRTLEEGVLAPKQLEQLLIQPLGLNDERPDLDGFYIRRGDLREALVNLRKARHPF